MKPDNKEMKQNIPVAIIGMSCFFPKASGLKEYWRLLFRGADAITDVPETHWLPEDYFNEDPKTPDHVYCKRGGFLSPISFDPSEFGIPPTSLEATDTSQLMGLVAAKMALEDSGYGDGRNFNRDKASVILGVTGTQELVIPLGARLGHPKWRRALHDAGVSPEQAEDVIERISDSYVSWQENSFPGLLGNVVAGRICNRLDFGGTNCVVDAACASSMSAIHLALMELVTGRAEMVITGGVDALNDIFMHTCFSKTLILSPTGDIRPFSKDADGTVLGEGIGMVVLKRLEDAEKDGDRIYAVIKSLGTSSDGKSQSIYAPRPEGQVKALRMAYKNADIALSTVELIEAHGTGTKVGDMVEYQALKSVFTHPLSASNDDSCSSTSDNWCALGSVKSMIGHTKAAAGAAGLIKSVLSLYHKIFPPTLKADEPDPNLGIEESPFYLSTETRPWFSKKEHPRRCGVSSFGFGGSNFHLVLEEYRKDKQEISWDGSVPRPELGNEKVKSGSEPGKIAFVFPGQGSQYVNMSRDLVCTFPEAFEALENANANSSFGNSRLTDFIYPRPARTKEEKAIQEERLRSTDVAQPAIGVISLAMLKILERFGLKPDATCGHSYGELTALYAAGWIDRDTLLHLSIARGHFMAAAGRNKNQDSGSMLAVKAPLDKIDALIAEEKLDVILANRNSPNQGVLSGTTEAIDRAEKICRQKKLRGIKLPVAAAFHSSLVKDAQEPFMETLQKVRIAPTDIPVFSNTTGNAYPTDPDSARQLLGGQILCPVDFVSQIENLYDSGIRTFLEVGPKSVLTSLVKAILKGRDIRAFSIDSSSGREFGIADLAKTLSHLASLGYPVDLDKWEHPAEPKKQRMSVLISGANYRSESKPKKLKKTSASKGTSEKCSSDGSGGHGKCSGNAVASRGSSLKSHIPDTPRQKAASRKTSAMRHQPRKPIVENRKAMDTISQKQFPDPQTRRQAPYLNQGQASPFVADAFRAVQEGLKSMQALQMQTAETHKKFLETQTEASRTLRQMMENTQRLTEVSMGIKVAPRSDIGVVRNEMPGFASVLESGDMPRLGNEEEHIQEHRQVGERIPEPVRTEISEPGVGGEIREKAAEVSTEKPVLPRVREDIQPSDNGQKKTEAMLLDVVSQLTGYPTGMLSMDMDIEADLGIDSIKRVEILSTLEERMPGLPTISPEIMGTLKTLGQIAEYLVGNLKLETGNSELETASESEMASSDIERKEIEEAMLEVVSQLTGYPTEMLSMDMNIEADLGIDSIKRVEILSTLEERMPDLPTVSPEIMGTLKTLGQIAEYLVGDSEHGNASSEYGSANTEAQAGSSELKITGNVERKVVSIVEAPFEAGEQVLIPSGRKVLVTDDGTGLGEAVVEEFRSILMDAVLVSPDVVLKDKDLPPAGGLIILSNPAFGLKDAFKLTRHVAQDILESAKAGGAIFGTVTRLDGAFGFNGRGIENPLQGGLAGLAKTAAIEWEDVCCHGIDIAPDWKDNKAVAKAVVTELVHSGPVEIGLEQNRRLLFELESSPYPRGKIALDPGDVVVITGGARGVTAAAAYALADHVKPTLVLLGRSPLPRPEPEWLASAEDEAAVRKAILKNEFSGNHVSPMQLQETFRKCMANREITRNLDQLKMTGATVLYYSADVRDAERMNSVLDEVRSAHGPVKAIIHGAGMLEDRLIIDKTPEQFERVFDTKVKGLSVLLEATKHDDLRYIVLFSSVSARMGNKGQVDYAMANEVLNKVAQQECVMRPNCRVTSINWGPWDGGMVSPALKREFERKGIELIPEDQGASCMLYEMMGDKSCPVEIVIGAGSAIGAWSGSRGERTEDSPQPLGKDKLSLTFKRELDVDRYPILGAHILGGRPVVPFALMTEWLGHGALHENPGLFLHGLDDIRLLSGIKLTDEKKLVRLLAGKARKKGAVYEVDVEIRNGMKDGKEVIHLRAKAILTDTLAQAPLFSMSEDITSQAYFRSIDEVYEKILFHGIELRGIKEILSCSSCGMVAKVSSAPSPEKWMADPLRSNWIGDPLVLDSAFQMAIIWCFEEKGVVSLPGYGASYRQYQNRFPSEGVTAVLEIRETAEHKMKGDFTFLDPDNNVVAQLIGYEAVMDASLFKAFKP